MNWSGYISCANNFYINNMKGEPTEPKKKQVEADEEMIKEYAKTEEANENKGEEREVEE